jgi:ABC-type Mn2+/Zn2+ transport system ATPase subunit
MAVFGRAGTVLGPLLMALVSEWLSTHQARGVTKQFVGMAALSQVSFDLRGGEILGPNGSRKTTLVNVISGRSSPGRWTCAHHPGEEGLPGIVSPSLNLAFSPQRRRNG